jgi:PIN domain nuclease of toxin-antitoxin system
MKKNYLLDTQVLIWYFDGNPQLDQLLAKEISDPDNAVFISRISFWEISIKISLGKLRLGAELQTLIQQSEQAGFGLLGLENEHILLLQTLAPHHRDPFDRILLAQCITEGLEIISSDAAFDAYPVVRRWNK